jgi:glutathione S-transferase
MLYLAERYGPTPLLPAKDDPAFARVLQLTVFGEASIGGMLNPLLTAKFGAPDADKSNWSVRTGEARVEQFVGYVLDVLGERAFLVGDDLTLADICVCTALGIWRDALDKVLPERLSAYQQRLQARPGYQRASAQQQR